MEVVVGPLYSPIEVPGNLPQSSGHWRTLKVSAGDAVLLDMCYKCSTSEVHNRLSVACSLLLVAVGGNIPACVLTERLRKLYTILLGPAVAIPSIIPYLAARSKSKCLKAASPELALVRPIGREHTPHVPVSQTTSEIL